MRWAHFLILPNIFVDTCCCYFENEPESSWIFCTRVTLTKIIRMQPKLLAEQDAIPMSLLLDFVSLPLVNIKEKQQYLVSFCKLPHLPILKGGYKPLFDLESEPGALTALCCLQASQDCATDVKGAGRGSVEVPRVHSELCSPGGWLEI